MAPKLRVLVSSDSGYPPSHVISVNSTTPTPIKTANFEGEISVWVKDFHGDGNGGDGKEYFSKRPSMTYGIVARGKYLDGPDGDEVVFGNTFEKPIRDSLPWGTSVAVKFMNFVDPTLELDIYADKPWALSPALASMSELSLSSSAPEKKEAWVDENSLEYLKDKDGVPSFSDETTEISGRRKWLGTAANRKQVSLKDTYVGMEFANGLLDFNTLSATLPQPFHLSINLLKYWDGQPVTYVCRRKVKEGSPVVPEGVYWAVAFEIIDEEAKKGLEKRGGKVEEHATKEGDKPEDDKPVEPKKEEDVKISDDVD